MPFRFSHGWPIRCNRLENSLGSNVRMRVHELHSHMCSGRGAEQISFDNVSMAIMDEPEHPDSLPPPLKQQNAMWGKELLKALNLQGPPEG